MHTSTILKEALSKFTKKGDFELSIVLFAIAVERLMKQHLYEVDAVLVLDKSNDTKHLVKFRRLQSKVKNEDFKQRLEALNERRENFKTITFDELIKRYDAFFSLDDERKASLKRLANLRNNIVHYFEYFIDEVDEGLFILNEIIPFIREIIQEVSDSEEYDEIFNEKLVNKLQALEQRLTKKQEDEIHRKIAEKRREYHEMSEEDIEKNKQLNIRDFYDERTIKKERIQCPACENYAFHILKIYDEENEENGQFITKGECLVCGLDLTEEELKSLKLIG